MYSPKTIALLALTGLVLGCTTNLYAQKKNSKNVIAPYEKYIYDNADQHLKAFQELASIPSISSIPAYAPEVQRAAVWIEQKMKEIGLTKTQIIPTGAHPVVFGSWMGAPGKPTVLIYAHYDVQPVKEAEWIHPPFTPTVEGDRLYGRGTSDDKSGVVNALFTAEAFLKTDGKLPVNIKYVFEGMEEIGSPSFASFLEQNKDLLKADYALNADNGQFDEQTPAMTLSMRGAAPLEFSIKTANTDAHSGVFGGKTPNSAQIMAQLLASFYDARGNVAVEGFYDKVIPITDEQRAMIKKIPYDPAHDMKLLGSTAEAGDTSYASLERIWYRPTLEIVGVESGYTAPEGHSNIIPSHAMARITCRRVNNQDGKELIDLIVKHIDKHLPKGATVSYKFSKGYASPFQLPNNTPEFNTITTVLKEVYGKEPLQLATGGSVGAMLSFKQILGIYAYPFGFALEDEGFHAANEFYRLSSLRKAQIALTKYFLLVGATSTKTKK